jgi:hypothetical protein
VKFLNTSMGIGVQILPGSTPVSGYFKLNVSITHPFSGTPRFTGFDVRGIFLSSGELDADGLIMQGPNDPRLLNADGWTRWWNPVEFTEPGLLGYIKGDLSMNPSGTPINATLNGYKSFADALLSNMDLEFLTMIPLTDQGGRAMFSSGKTNVREYRIQFPVDAGPKIYFDYAIDACWTLPNPDPPVQVPKDFPIQANAPEAFIVTPEIVSNSLAGTPYGGASSGELVLSVDVWDWQGWSNGSYLGQIGNVKFHSPYVHFDPPIVVQEDDIHSTKLTITATGMPYAVGTVPVVLEIPAPGASWKQSWQAAPDGEVAVFSVFDIEIGAVVCSNDENVTCDNAIPLALTGSTIGSVCMPLDPTDFFMFVVPTGGVMEGTVSLNNYNYSDNDLMLYNSCPGSPFETATTEGTMSEMLEVGNLESGSYYIAVLPGGSAGTDVQPYELTLDIHQVEGPCTLDNDNDSADATLIGLSAQNSDSVCAGLDIRDWYTLSVPPDKVAGGTISVINAGVGDVNIRVYETYPGPATFWSTNPGVQSEMVLIDGLGPGYHFIEIYAQGTSPEGDRGYTLQTDLPVSDFVCTTGDGNDSALVADPIGYTDIISGTVCYPADPDWVMFDVDDNKAVSGTITLAGNMLYDNDLYLYQDPSAAPLYVSANVGIDDEQIVLELLPTGTYYVKMSAHPSVGTGDQDYTLTMAIAAESVGDFDFTIHAHVICNTDGTSPAASDSKVQQDVDWADEFWSEWGGSFKLVEISYINHTSWLAASTNEMVSCDQQYADNTGPINVYYVNSFTNLEGAAAYAIMDCRYHFQTHNFTYIVMSDAGKNGSLAHELAHATAILQDMYLLDYYTCNQLYAAYCPYPPNNSYCDQDDAEWGNLMYWQVSNWTHPYQYHLSDYHFDQPEKPIESQVENWTYFHKNYPDNFPN